MTDSERLRRIIDALDGGASVHAVALKERITRSSVQYHVRMALKTGALVKIDGRGRHKRPVYRRPRTGHGGIEAVPGASAPPVQTVAPPYLPPGLPNDEWRLLERGQFAWVVHLSRGVEIPWDPASDRMKNGVRWLKRRYHLLGSVWATLQLYSGTFRAVLHLDKIPVRWADASKWNDLLWTLAVEAQRRLGRDLADLGVAVTQEAPEPIEDPKAAASRREGHPTLITGELRIPLEGVGSVPRQLVTPYEEVNGSPPGPAAEGPSVKYGYVLDHLPERVMALEAANARIAASLERMEAGVASLAGEMAKLASAQERIAAALEKLLGAKKDAGASSQEPSGPAPWNPDNWRMYG